MGYRNITEIEYKYIKELAQNHKGKYQLRDVVRISNRSDPTIRKILESDSYAEYREVKRSEHDPKPKETKEEKKEYSGHAVAEFVRIRRALERIANTLEQVFEEASIENKKPKQSNMFDVGPQSMPYGASSKTRDISKVNDATKTDDT